MGAEVDADQLGDEWKGYVLRVAGGNDKQGFPMKQGVLTNSEYKQKYAISPLTHTKRRIISYIYLLMLAENISPVINLFYFDRKNMFCMQSSL